MKDKREHHMHGAMDKCSLEQQFCKHDYKISEDVHLVQPGGRQAGWLVGRQNAGKFWFFKIHCRSRCLFGTCPVS